MKRTISFFVAIFGIAFTSGSLAAIQYTITDLGTLPGGTGSGAVAVSSAGLIAGQSNDSQVYFGHAFLWTPSGGMIDLLHTPEGASSNALDVNDSAQVVGITQSNAYAPTRGFFYDGGTVISRGLSADGRARSEAVGINASGQVAGDGQIGDQNSHPHAFRYDHGVMLDLGTLPNGLTSTGVAINDVGQVAGTADTNGRAHAFRWSAQAGMVDLGSLGPGTEAWAMNNSGSVVGRTRVSDEDIYFHAFLYTDENGMVDLEPSGVTDSAAWGINDNEDIVGSCFFGGAVNGSVFIDHQGAFLDLNTLIDPATYWHLINAYDINNAGQIVGLGYHDLDGPGGNDPVVRAYLLTTVPEPEGLALTALAALPALRRRNRA